MRYQKYTNEKWKAPKQDFIVVYTDKEGKVVKIMYEAAGAIAGGGYAYRPVWNNAEKTLQDLIETFPQLWLQELRNEGVKI